MACFLVSAAEAVVTTTVMKQVKRREDKASTASEDEHKIVKQDLSWIDRIEEFDAFMDD